jgi:tRNA (cytidine/uridine-2'-O-)-methyltransferase
MIEVVLFEPEIPANTGAAMRLCANAGSRLHLVRPLGFRLHDRALARAGLDYRELVDVTVHADWEACCARFGARRLLALTTRSARPVPSHAFALDDVLVFGAESRGLPAAMLATFPAEHRLRIPMVPGSRSLNLASAVAVALYEGWRQCGFTGAAPSPGSTQVQG